MDETRLCRASLMRVRADGVRTKAVHRRRGNWNALDVGILAFWPIIRVPDRSLVRSNEKFGTIQGATVCGRGIRQDGVAVGVGPDDRAHTERSARSAAVFDNDRLAELRAERLEQRTRHNIGRAAGGEWNEGPDVFQAEPRVLGGQVTAHNQHGRSSRYTQPPMRAGSWPTIELQTINFQWRRPPLVRASNALVRGPLGGPSPL